LRDVPSVQQREPPIHLFACDVCYEYDKTWYAYKQAMGEKDPTEFFRLYDRLGELRELIDGFLREQRIESEKNAGPRITKKDWPDWKDGS
jgi:hypothetical protein